MLFRKTRKRSLLTTQQSLAAKPLHLVKGELEPAKEPGIWNLVVTVKTRHWASRIVRMPETQKKTFEFDAMGALVWESCDGKTSVQQIVRKLAKRYKITLREADVSTRQFLQMLTRKRLIALAVPKPGEKPKVEEDEE